MNATSPHVEDFEISHGGPFYELQRRLGVLHRDSLRVRYRAALFVAIAWVVPLLLSLMSGQAWGDLADRPYLLDPRTWAQFVIAVGAFVLTERHLEDRLRWCLREFSRAPILAPSSFTAAILAVNKALRRRDSALAEASCLALALALSMIALIATQSSDATSWRVERLPVGLQLTPAGWWQYLISLPIFWFLFFRALWRHLVWSMLLRSLARLKLRVVVSHPDGNGGLAFIGQYPNAYALFILGASSVLAATLANQFVTNAIKVSTYGYVMGGWLAIVLGLFVYPLSAFITPLSELKRQTRLIAGAQATRFHRLAERKLLGANIVWPDEAEDAGTTELVDSSRQYDLAGKLSVFLVKRDALFPVALAAVLPLAIAGATKLPYKEILGIAKKLLLL